MIKIELPWDYEFYLKTRPLTPTEHTYITAYNADNNDKNVYITEPDDSESEDRDDITMLLPLLKGETVAMLDHYDEDEDGTTIYAILQEFVAKQDMNIFTDGDDQDDQGISMSYIFVPVNSTQDIGYGGEYSALPDKFRKEINQKLNKNYRYIIYSEA